MPALELRFVVRTRECEGRGDEGDGAEGCCRARQRHDGQVGCTTPASVVRAVGVAHESRFVMLLAFGDGAELTAGRAAGFRRLLASAGMSSSATTMVRGTREERGAEMRNVAEKLQKL